jgi:lipoprotein NlpI
MRVVIALGAGLALLCPAFTRADADDPLAKAKAALGQGKTDQALALVGQALRADPENADAYYVRGLVWETLGRHREAIADYDRVIKKNPQAADAYDHRGSEHFKLGRFAASLADFDKYLEMKPAEKPGHWRRGITCYYAERFEEGRKQFESYEKVDGNDVENAVWSFLCRAREVGVDKARPALLKIGHDRRVPLMAVYALYAGRAKPDDVLAAARAGKPSPDELRLRLFYAHLYLGLYCEVAGDRKGAYEHLRLAARDYGQVGHYMGDVARVHFEWLQTGQDRK